MTDDRREWYIYVLRDPRNDEVRYVGFTTDVVRRLGEHLSEAVKGIRKSHKASWIRSLLLLDLQPVIEVIDHGIGGDWQSVEKYWILHHRMQSAKLTNSTDGGDGVVGHKMSSETIEKMRQAQLGRKHSPESIEKRRRSLLGRKLSPEHIKKMRQARLGRKLSSEHIEKTRQANLGRKRSPETIEKMRARKRSPETQEGMRQANLCRCIPVRRVEDGMIFASLSDAARSVDKNPGSVQSALVKGHKCAGYHWERVGETLPADPYTLDGNALMMRVD